MFLRSLIFTVLVLVAGAQVAQPQLPTASFRGTVVDSGGAAVTGAKLRLQNASSGVLERDLQTDESGSFAAQTLPPGSYHVEIAKDGFATQTQSIELLVGRVLVVNFTMSVQPVLQSVTVNATAPLVDPESSEVGGDVEPRAMASLPLNGRQFGELATLVPGVLPAPNFDPIKTRILNIVAEGSDGRSSNFSIDGAENTDLVNGGLLQGFTIEGIQEFHVASSRFGADQGRALGAAVNVVTRSGTNDFHGSYFIFYRNQALNARDFFQKTKPDFHRTQQGFTIGGPIRKDRTHFFTAFENFDEMNLGIVNTNGIYPQFEGSFPLPFTARYLTTRVDHSINEKNKLMFRYSFENNFSTQGIGGARAADNGIRSTNRGSSLAATYTRVISAHTVNTLLYSYSQFNNHLLPLSLAPEIDHPDLITGGAFNTPQSTLISRHQIRDDLSWTLPSSWGEHNLKFGVDYNHATSDGIVEFASRGQFAFFSDAPLSATNADLLFLAVGNFVFPTFADNIIGLYAQDDWKVKKRLTLNLGLRWDLSTNENNPDFTSPLAPRGVRRRDYNNWGPRVGFAFDVTGSGKTIVRGGYGIFYALPVETDPSVESAFDGRRNGFGLFSGPIDVNNPFPGLSPAQIQAAVFAQPQLLLITLANHLRTAYTQQTSIGFQKELFGSVALTVDYVHNLGLKEHLGRDINLDPNGGIGTPGTMLANEFGPALAASLGPVVRIDDAGKSSYNSLQISANKRFSRNFQFQAAYTLSHAVDMGDDSIGSTVANPFDLRPERGDSNRDQRHRFVLNGLVHLPRDFELSTITSFSSARPFDIITGASVDGSSPTRPPGVTRNMGARDNAATLAAINAFRAANMLAPITTTSPKSFFFFSSDVRLTKSFKIKERFALVGAIEGFNLFNHVNFLSNGGPTFSGVSGAQTNVLAPDFALPHRTAGGVLGSGGPRAAQLMFRFEF